MPDLTQALPSALRRRARWHRLGAAGVPALIVRPDADAPCPVVLWMHGRTVSKELDPGRYLRWMRAGFGTCAVDLPGHGERREPRLETPEHALDVVKAMVEEIDPVLDALDELGGFDLGRCAIGGVSAGGMATLVRLCRPHGFRCASVEATTGSWRHQSDRPGFRDRGPEVDELDPIRHLDRWREIPLQAIHAEADRWVSFAGQLEFVEALRRRYRDPQTVELVRYERTGAPYEHAGFGRLAADAKSRQLRFLRRWL